MSQGHKMTFPQEITFPWEKTSVLKVRKITSFPKIRSGQDRAKTLGNDQARHFPKTDSSYDSKPASDVREK